MVWPGCQLETGRRYPSVAFFAARDVAEGEELTFTYNSDTKEVGSQIATPGTEVARAECGSWLMREVVLLRRAVCCIPQVTESGQVRCYCGAASCRGYI